MKRVLVVDDETMILTVLKQILERLGYTVETALDDRQALAAVRAAEAADRRFALVILDLTIPGGARATDTLRALRAVDPTIRIVASSGYVDDPVMVNPAAHGFVDRLTKPYRRAELAQLMARLAPQTG